jgi:hypothetical protein
VRETSRQAVVGIAAAASSGTGREAHTMEEMRTIGSASRRYASGDARVCDAARNQAVAELNQHLRPAG